MTKLRQEFEARASEQLKKYDQKLVTLREELELRRKTEIHEIEEVRSVFTVHSKHVCTEEEHTWMMWHCILLICVLVLLEEEWPDSSSDEEP